MNFTDASNFKQAANLKLTESDIIDLAHSFNVDPIAVWAVLKNETGGKGGFDALKRPKILFEGHIFYNLTKKKGLVIENNANNFIYAKWADRGNAYKLDQYVRLEEAIKHDRECALQSASYGLGQIMGSNYKACGFANVDSFIAAMYNSEKEQFRAMLTFIKSNKVMFEAMNNKNWATFAKCYNGPGYAQNKYDVKLAATYEANKGKANGFV